MELVGSSESMLDHSSQRLSAAEAKAPHPSETVR